MFKYILQNSKTKKYYKYCHIYMNGVSPHDVTDAERAHKFNTEEEAKEFNKSELSFDYIVRKILE